jgi:hypothetical protein
MSNQRKITVRHYREIAEKVRQLARQASVAEIREELFDLADRLEKMGERDSAVGLEWPREDNSRKT